MTVPKPDVRPARPHFSSGPCAKPPGWAPEKLATGSLGRSHRSKLGKARLGHAVELTRHVLRVPATHRIGIVPASDTGAVEMALWNLLGRPAGHPARLGELRRGLGDRRGQAAEARGDRARARTMASFPISRRSIRRATWSSPGTAPPRASACPTATGSRDDRAGLTICDATSAAFAVDLPWDKLDVVTYSWQKVLGGEGAHGVLILSERAVERLESHTPAWPLPKIFRLTKGGKLIEGIFKGETINTPSMLAVEDYLWALEWAELQGGLDALIARADANAAALSEWVERTDWIEHLAADPATRSNTSVCLKFADPSSARKRTAPSPSRSTACSSSKASPTT